MIDFKTQTRRSTKFHRDIININLFVRGNNFEFGVVTSKYWGDYKDRKDPLIEIDVDNKRYNIPLSKFKSIIKKHLKSWINWDYTQDNKEE